MQAQGVGDALPVSPAPSAVPGGGDVGARSHHHPTELAAPEPSGCRAQKGSLTQHHVGWQRHAALPVPLASQPAGEAQPLPCL